MTQPKRKLRYVLALVALVWVVCLWGLRSRRTLVDLREPATTETTSAAARSGSATTRGAKRIAAAPIAMPGLRKANLIESIDIDNPRPCAGESFLVSIRGKPENAGSTLPIAELNYNIGGTFGDTIALSANIPGTQGYTVVASNGIDKIEHRAFNVEVLPLTASECQGRAIATLSVEASKYDANQVLARVVAHSGLEAPLHYRWDFGDGAQIESSGPEASHDYALRAQQRTLSSYLISVHVSDARGRSAEGRATIHLMNNHYRARMFGARLVQAIYDRFPVATSDAYRVDVTFRSFEPEVVVL